MKKQRTHNKNFVGDPEWIVQPNEMPPHGVFGIYLVSAYTEPGGKLLGCVVGCSQGIVARLHNYTYNTRHEVNPEALTMIRLQEQAALNGNRLHLAFDLIEEIGCNTEVGMKTYALAREKYHIGRLRAEGFTLFNK